MVNLTQLLIGIPVGLLLLWAALRLHRRMFRRPGERWTAIDVMVMVVMAGMSLLLALTLVKAIA